MHRYCWLALPCLLLCGCVAPAESRLDYPVRHEVLEWCAPEVIAAHRDTPASLSNLDCRQDDTFCRQSAKAMMACVPELSRETPRGTKVHGRFLFGVTTDAQGGLTNLCLIDTDLGKTPGTLRCAAWVARSGKVKFQPDLKDWLWKLTWVLE